MLVMRQSAVMLMYHFKSKPTISTIQLWGSMPLDILQKKVVMFLDRLFEKAINNTDISEIESFVNLFSLKNKRK